MDTPQGSLERLLKRDRAAVIVSLAAISLLAWTYLTFLTLDMARDDMRLMGMEMAGTAGGMVMEPQAWTSITYVLMLLMWWIMMIGMMLPSAAPMILLFAGLQRQQMSGEAPRLRITLFALGYLLAWFAFSATATTAQWGLGELNFLSPTMKTTSSVVGVLIFAGAGLYQFTPFKHACLTHCRAPVQFLSAHWRKGNLGALQMGLHHGAYCVGCCWFLMALLFVGGVMNLVWVAAIAMFVLLEKIVPKGLWVARGGGALMIAFAAFLASRAI